MMRDFIASQNSERLRQRIARSLHVREPAAFARLAGSLIDAALVTGIVARLYRAFILGRAGEAGAGYIALTFALGAIFLLGMTALHVSRFPVRAWAWRAPAFAFIEGVAEMVTSAVLIALSREPLGSGAATFRDWPGMALRTIGWRIVTITLFALLLAAVVQWVRSTLRKRDHAAWSGVDFVERRRGP